MISLVPLIMLTISLLLLHMAHLGYGRSIRDNMDLISDGSDSDLIRIQNLRESITTVTCEPLYGFLPCTTNIWGHLFMIVVYQYLISQGEMYVSSASNRFVELHGPGSILGGSLFYLLPTIPQLFLVLASGLSASTETAEQQAAMGMQLLAGSAVMMLTLVWGACVAFGSSPLSNGFGLVTYRKTRWIARIMLLSMIPIIILQLPKMMNSSSETRLIILIAFIVTAALLIVYITYQVTEPWILKWRFDYLLQKYVRDKVCKHLCRTDGKPNAEAIEGIFHKADENNDKMLSKDELRNFITRLKLGEYDRLMGIDDYVDHAMREIDSKPDGKITKEEFVNAISGWIKKVKKRELEEQCDAVKPKDSLSFQKLVVEYVKASFELVVGVAFVAILATPYVQTVSNFSVAANIPQFWVPYVVMPLAMNFRMALGFINAARKKTECSISLTLSKIYGSVYLNNLVGLTTFLALVYTRDLTWDVSAEVLVVLIICTSIGVIASFRKKFPFWISFIAFMLYPISLLLLYVFRIVLGWS